MTDRKHLKSPDLIQSVHVMVRLTETEADVLDRDRGKIPRGTFVRNSYLRKGGSRLPEINKRAYSELARSAANLNQIAKHLNMGDEVLAQQIRNELMQFRSKLLGVNDEGNE